jgi:hypothetical protein
MGEARHRQQHWIDRGRSFVAAVFDRGLQTGEKFGGRYGMMKKKRWSLGGTS